MLYIAAVSYTHLAGFNLSGGYTHLNTQDVELEQPIDKSIKNAYNINAQWAHSWKIYRLNINLNGRFNSKRFSKSYGYAPEYQLWDLNTRHSFNLKSVIDVYKRQTIYRTEISNAS